MIKEKSKQYQKLLGFWAADCAEHVLKYFEKRYPKDKRPRKAILAARLWAKGKIKCGEARKAALAAHAAARRAGYFTAAQFAARAAGHAAATAHVARHAFGAVYYGIKTVIAAGKSGEKERKWQDEHSKLLKNRQYLKMYKYYQNRAKGKNEMLSS